MLMEEDLSLRHLPEVSDYSFSFQIPTSSMPKGDDLLADDNNFFEGANTSILATPAPVIKPTNHTPSRIVSQSTPRPSGWESSAVHQQRQRHVASPSPSGSYGQAQGQPSPIIEESISNKELGRRKAEDPHEEEEAAAAGYHKYERQEQPPRPFTSTTPSTSLNDIPPSPPSTFPERSPLESHLEVGHAHVELGLHVDGSQPQVSAAATDLTKEEHQVAGKLQGSQKLPVGNKLGRGVPTEGRRSTAITKALNRPIIAGGIAKSRNHKKSGATVSARPKTESSAPTIASLLAKTPTKPEAIGDGLITDETQNPDLSLSSFVSDRGVAGRLVAYSQQLMNRKKDTMGASSSVASNAEPSCKPEREKAHSSAQETKLNAGDQRIDPSRGSDIIDSGVGHRSNDDQDEPLTLSQLSPRKRRVIRSTAGQVRSGVPSFPPTLPAPEPMDAPQRTSKKRSALSASNCHDQPIRKKGKGRASPISGEEGSDLARAVPIPTPAFTPGDSLLHSASASSLSALSEVGSCSSGTAVNDLGLIIEDDGDKEEVNVGKSGPAKSTSASAMISGTVPMGSKVGKQSGSTVNPKRVVSGLTGTGPRTRLRRASKACSSVNGGRTLRPRSVSASVHAEVMRASERGRRVTQVRVRREAREKRGKLKLIETHAGAEDDAGNIGSSVKSDLKRSGLTYRGSSTRPVEFKFASDLRIQARKGDEGRMTRSASSMSSSSGGGGQRLHPIPSVKLRRGEGDDGKENVQARPFHLATEERIKERRKFDETVREKEREREMEEEEKRREREEEEEREVRELRKRAVPKANVVPEWYKDAPKKSKDGR